MSRSALHRGRRVLSPVFCACLLLLVSGCYEQVSRDGQSIYRFAWWLGPLVILGGVIFIPVGWMLRKVIHQLGYTLILMSPFLLALVAPTMYHDKVIIDDEHFEMTYGFWFDPTVLSIRYDELEEMRLVAVPTENGRSKPELRCRLKGGEVVVVPMGDLVKFAVPEMMRRANQQGIPAIDRTHAY